MLKHQSIKIFQNFFSLTYVENPGAAFGLLADLNPAYRTIFFLVVACLALIAVGFLYYTSCTQKKELAKTATVLIMSGAIGNLIDRIRFDVVIDFLDFHWYNYHWPAFNVADSAITVGVILLLIDSILEETSKKTAHPA